MTKSKLKEGGERKADDGPVPQHEVNGVVCGLDGDLQDGDLQLLDSALLHGKCLTVVAGLVRLGDEEKKPTSTHATCPAGTGFWQVGKSQPIPTPAATCTHDLYGLHNPWFSLEDIVRW
jgi:hypothetical protein